MINGDSKLSISQRVLYFLQCIKNWFQIIPRNKLSISSVNLQSDPDSVGTPSRILSNMFWKNIDWNNIASQLGDKVNIFDIACGRGQYGLKYREYLGENFESYTGLDIYKSSDFPDSFIHILDKAENLTKYYNNQNLIVSQSALEHIEKDIQVLTNSLSSQLSSKEKFMQIHLVPASASLFLYLWHGWRQYSLRNLSSISNELNSIANVQIKIFPIGGLNSFYTHLIYVTLPVILSKIFKFKADDWNIECTKASLRIRSAVLKDRKVKGHLPTFWAFVIASEEMDCSNLFKQD